MKAQTGITSPGPVNRGTVKCDQERFIMVALWHNNVRIEAYAYSAEPLNELAKELVNIGARCAYIRSHQRGRIDES